MVDASYSLSCFIQYCLNFNLNFLKLWIRIDFSVVLPLSAAVVDANSILSPVTVMLSPVTVDLLFWCNVIGSVGNTHMAHTHLSMDM